MNVSPEHYDSTNHWQMGFGKMVIEEIKQNNTNNEIPIALDIGCGSGNVTKLLKQTINIKHLYAIDVVPEMIDFARRQHSMDGITYVCQDFSRDFDQWTKLKHLKGKVSLVFSNECLHWIKDIETVANNIGKLCAPDASVYILVTLAQTSNLEFLDKLAGNETNNQIRNWRDKFSQAGFEIVNCEHKSDDQVFDQDHYLNHLVPGATILLKKRLPLVSWMLCDRLTRALTWLFYRHRYISFRDQTTGKPMMRYITDVLFLKLNKI